MFFNFVEWIILLNIFDSIEWIIFWMNILDFILNWILNWIIFWPDSMKKWIFKTYRPGLPECVQTCRDCNLVCILLWWLNGSFLTVYYDLVLFCFMPEVALQCTHCTVKCSCHLQLCWSLEACIHLWKAFQPIYNINCLWALKCGWF